MTKIWTKIRHNQCLFVGFILSISVLLWAWGCQSKVMSIVNPTVLITRGELDIEVEAFVARTKLKYADLDKQDEFKLAVFNTALDFMKGGQINPVAVAIVIGNILGLGAVIDNRRKDVIIKTMKGNSQNGRDTKPT